MIKIKKSGSMRRKVSKNHPFKQHCPNLFKSHNEAIDRYSGERASERLIRKMKKSGNGPIIKPC